MVWYEVMNNAHFKFLFVVQFKWHFRCTHVCVCVCLSSRGKICQAFSGGFWPCSLLWEKLQVQLTYPNPRSTVIKLLESGLNKLLILISVLLSEFHCDSSLQHRHLLVTFWNYAKVCNRILLDSMVHVDIFRVMPYLILSALGSSNK